MYPRLTWQTTERWCPSCKRQSDQLRVLEDKKPDRVWYCLECDEYNQGSDRDPVHIPAAGYEREE